MYFENEEIKPIPNFDGYFVSKNGRIFSNRPINGKGNKRDKLREIKPLKCSKGRYLQFTASNGKTATKVLIHRAVLETFVGACPVGKEVSHKDGNSHNNRLENLEYVTHKENESMKKIHGTSSKGEGNVNARLSIENVKKIKEALLNAKRGTARKLSKQFGVSESTISSIKHNKLWREEF